LEGDEKRKERHMKRSTMLLGAGLLLAMAPQAMAQGPQKLGRTALVRRISYRGATYAWDVPQWGEGEHSGQPWPGGQGTVPVRSWPELAELTAAQAAAFLIDALSRGSSAPGRHKELVLPVRGGFQ